MSHKTKLSLKQQVFERLHSMLTPGRSRHQAKQNGSQADSIFSYRTFHNYLDWCSRFVSFCKERHRCKSLDECRAFVDEFLTEIIKTRSPSTVKSYASAIAKLYGCSAKDFTGTPARHRADIKRSRRSVGMDKHFSRTNNADLIRFVQCTGLRRSELSMLNGDEYSFRNGALFVHVRNGKGGKQRDAKVIGSSEDIEFVLKKMQFAGTGRVFRKIHSAFDQHAERAMYTARYYSEIARPVGDIPRTDRYCCRKDLKGLVLDKRAMLDVSRSLGHNRIDVIAGHYAYRFGQS